MLTDVFKTHTGSIIISVVLGLGLATVFRRVCKGNHCIVVKSPRSADLAKYYYKIDDDCFKYEPYATQCPVSMKGSGESQGSG